MVSPLISYLERFGPIPVSDRPLLLEAFEERAYDNGAYLFSEGRICTKLFFIMDGILRISSINERGIDQTRYFYTTHHFCTILKSFTEGTASDASIQAMCDTRVLIISRNRLLALYSMFPYLTDLIDKMIQQQ